MSRKSEDFKELEAYWYKKLRDEGFRDIEKVSDENRPLNSWNEASKRIVSLANYETTIKYFERANDILVHHKFTNLVHKEIWKLHCDGLTEREIARRIGVFKKSTVHVVIKNIAKLIKRE